MATGHFARLNALVENGWLSVLDAMELRLWLAYEKFAGMDGIAYPDGQTLARLMGHADKTHVGRARRSLQKRELLRVIESGGGRGNMCRIQMLEPPSRTRQGELFIDEKVAESATFHTRIPPVSASPMVAESATICIEERLPNRHVKVAESTRKGCRIDLLLNKEEQPKNNPRTTQACADKPRALELESQDAGVKTPSKRVADRKLTDEQEAARKAFSDWWTGQAYPARFGVKYEFKSEASRNAKAVLSVLGSENVGWDLAIAMAAATAFLDDGDRYLAARGKKLYDLAPRLERFVSLARDPGGKENGYANGNGSRRTAAARGEYASDLPIDLAVRQLPKPASRAGTDPAGGSALPVSAAGSGEHGAIRAEGRDARAAG